MDRTSALAVSGLTPGILLYAEDETGHRGRAYLTTARCVMLRSALRQMAEKPPEEMRRTARLTGAIESQRVDERDVAAAPDVVGYHETDALARQRLAVLRDRQEDRLVLESRIELAPRHDRLV